MLLQRISVGSKGPPPRTGATEQSHVRQVERYILYRYFWNILNKRSWWC